MGSGVLGLIHTNKQRFYIYEVYTITSKVKSVNKIKQKS